MLICLPDILNADEVRRCRAIVENAPWEDGRATAGTQSATVKHNRQLPRDSEAGRDAGRIILQAMTSNAQFLSAALPHQMMPPLFNRYAVGENFGVHVDNAIRGIGGGVSIRTDLSMTVFLSDATDYDGGELTVETLYGPQEVKLPAGHAVLYPATSLHRVAPVTRGKRIASFFWIQSMIRDEAARTMLYDLDQTIQSLAVERGIDDAHVVRLTGFYHNLIRRWAEV